MYTTRTGITRLAPLPRGTFETYTFQNGACWLPGEATTVDIPVGFTDSGSLLLYFQIGPTCLGFNAVYSMSWASRHSALLAYSPWDYEIPPEPCGVLYASTAYAASAWYSLEQLNPPPYSPLTPTAGPMLSPSTCAALGLGWVAIALSTPFTGPGATYGSCNFPFPWPLQPVYSKLTEL
jgi:hypothetical protein